MTTTLYLVSAETPEGNGYWKVGVTRHIDPLKRNRKAYQEVFRAELFADDGDAKDIEIAIARTFKAVAPSPHGRETLDYRAGLEIAGQIFDFCLNESEQWTATATDALAKVLQDNPELERTAINLYGRCAVGKFAHRGFDQFLADDKLQRGHEEWMPWGRPERQRLDGALGWIECLEDHESNWGCGKAIEETRKCLDVCLCNTTSKAWDRYSKAVAGWKKSFVDCLRTASAEVCVPMW